MKTLSAALIVTTLFATSHAARAQGPPRAGPDVPADTATSEQLFYDGRNLMAQHRYAEACAVFERAETLHTTIGVMLNLADCYEQAGRGASAWSMFHEAVLEARKAHDSREVFALQRIAALEPKLVRLTIDASTLSAVPGAVVRIDGKPLDTKQRAVGFPVDPGRHTVDAQAPGKQPWSMTFDAASSMTIGVPRLQGLRPESASQTPIETAMGSAPPPVDQSSTRLGLERKWALVAGSVGVVGLAIGSVFGAISMSKHDSAASHCTNRDNPCDPTGVAVGGEAQSAGDVSTVAFVLGAAALAGGVTLWLIAPSTHASPDVALVSSAGPQGAGLWVKGAW
jgi:hypothetical protein